jgi:hypothetical protein
LLETLVGKFPGRVVLISALEKPIEFGKVLLVLRQFAFAILVVSSADGFVKTLRA